MLKKVLAGILITACVVEATTFNVDDMDAKRKMSTQPIDSVANYNAIDMYRNQHSLIIKMDVPGTDFQDIHVEIRNKTLYVFGNRRAKEEITKENYYSREVSYGSFERSISLPNGIDESGMRYFIDKGVLTVTMPVR